MYEVEVFREGVTEKYPCESLSEAVKRVEELELEYEKTQGIMRNYTWILDDPKNTKLILGKVHLIEDLQLTIYLN